VEDVKRYAQMVKYPDLTPTTVRNAGLVRAGRMSRDEALEIERRQLEEPVEPSVLDTFLADLGMSREEFDAYARQA
ncbi:MAG: hypothetical protein R6X16_13635, partial [Anaerolineae bacterium]